MRKIYSLEGLEVGDNVDYHGADVIYLKVKTIMPDLVVLEGRRVDFNLTMKNNQLYLDNHLVSDYGSIYNMSGRFISNTITELIAL